MVDEEETVTAELLQVSSLHIVDGSARPWDVYLGPNDPDETQNRQIGFVV